MVIKTEKTKYIQFVFFHLTSMNKRFRGLFISLLLNNILENESLYKQEYVNSVLYLGSYLIRARKCSNKMAKRCIQEVVKKVQALLQGKGTVATPDSNLLEVFHQN